MNRLQQSLRAAAAVFVLAAGAQAGTFYVDASLTTGANDGSSWANAFRGTIGLQIAFSNAGSGDEIYVREGTYLPSPTGSRNSSFTLESGLEVYGGFAGGEASPAERPPFGTAPTILQGDLGGNDAMNLFNDNVYHVVNGASVNSTAILDGFVVNGGNANSGVNNQDVGGGILCFGNSNPTIRNCTFTNNRCTFGGGAGYINGSAPSFINCQFIDNFGNNFGGAFDIANSGAVNFDRCTFTGNRAARAGAIEVFFTSGVRITNCLIYDNTATGSGGGGGIWTNSATNCQIRNCTIVGNTATSTTVAGIRNAGGAAPSTINCILWDNSGIGGAQNSANQTNVPVTYSIVMNGGTGTGNSGADPQFADAANDDYSLSASSPAIDAGNNAGVAAGLLLDVAGNPRFADVAAVADTGAGTAPIVDMGAFEASDSPFTPYCFGDGSGTQCPCGNNSSAGHPGGCAHQDGDGAILTASGVPSVAADTLRFDLTSGAFNTFALLVSGVNQLPQMGGCIGCGLLAADGLRCAGGNFLRHGSRAIGPVGETFNPWGPPAGPAGGLIAANGFTAGQTRNFFAFFRTDQMQSCGNGQNSTNGVSVTFTN